jgi:chromate transporter
MDTDSRNGLTPPRVPLATLFRIFFKIACTSFGGFMAMIAVVQSEVVERRRLMAHAEMLDGVSLASILPGPVAVNLVAYVGYRLRGGLGALVSAFAAVLPSFVLIVLLSIAYFRWGQIPGVSKLFLGFLPAVTAVILAAAWNMGRKAVTGVSTAVIAAASAAVLLLVGGFFSTLAIILAAGFAGYWLYRGQASPADAAPPPPPPGPASLRVHAGLMLLGSGPVNLLAPLFSIEPNLLLKVFVTFAGMSLMLFGGAYVFIPLIQEIVVDGHGWVSQREFVDAVAMGQITPGPVLVSAAFVGLKVAGLAGAVLATLGIYLPSALLMLGSTRVLDRIKRSAAVRAALQGVRPAVVGMIAAAAWSVGSSAPPHWASLLIFAAALAALLRFRLDVVWVIPPAGVAGLLLF